MLTDSVVWSFEKTHPIQSIPERSVLTDRTGSKTVSDPSPIMIRSNGGSVLASPKTGPCGSVDRTIPGPGPTFYNFWIIII
jgi:hypothetical protein